MLIVQVSRIFRYYKRSLSVIQFNNYIKKKYYISSLIAFGLLSFVNIILFIYDYQYDNSILISMMRVGIIALAVSYFYLIIKKYDELNVNHSRVHTHVIRTQNPEL